MRLRAFANPPGTLHSLCRREAVQQINGVDVVFVRRAEEDFEVRTVKAGARADGEIEILQGLAAKEAVVVKGGFLLKSQLLKNTIQDN